MQRIRLHPSIPAATLLLALVAAGLQPPAAYGQCNVQAAHISITDPVVSEAAGTVTFEIHCNPCGPVHSITRWVTADGSAVAPGDYASDSGIIDSIGVSTTPEVHPVVISIVNDAVHEPDETFQLQIFQGIFNEQAYPSVGPPCFILDETSGTATIQNDDPVNSPPTAEAGGPYFVAEGGSVALDGSGSSDPDGDPLTYQWDLDGDATFGEPGETGATPTFSAAGLDGPTSVVVSLRVSDGIATDTDTATVNVTNVAPEIGAINLSAPSINEGNSVTVSGSFSDPALGVPSEMFSGSALWSDGVSTPLSVGAGTFSTSRNFADDHPASGTASDPFTVAITISDDDSGSDTESSGTLTVHNVAPEIVSINLSASAIDEGGSVTVSGSFSDPALGVASETFSGSALWSDGVSSALTVGAGTFSTSRSFADDDPTGTPSDTFTVDITIDDDDTGSDTDTSPILTVNNVAPTVAAPTFTPTPTDEGEAVVASASFTDPGVNDTFTCTVDYGDGAEAGTVSGLACTGPSHVYGDNGSFPVTVAVTDDDTGVGSNTANHQVLNVDPEVALDLSTAVAFPGGDAFLGRLGDEQSHDADADDPGSDDLTFDWDFGFVGSGVSTTYFNDTGDPSGTPDPTPSPDGTFPFSASDTAAVTFASPGVFTVRVDVTDDDGGSDFEDLPKLVTGDGECSFSQGYWRHQVSQQGRPHVDPTTLQAYLDLVDFASAVFSELVNAADVPSAQAVMAPAGNDFRAKATQQALAAWLNFASGGVGWTEGIDLDGDDVADASLATVIGWIEGILLDPLASHQDLELAKDLAEAVNLRDAENSDCS